MAVEIVVAEVPIPIPAYLALQEIAAGKGLTAEAWLADVAERVASGREGGDYRMSLWLRGFDDREIARRVGVQRPTIAHWRKVRHLPRNGRSRA